MGVGVVGGGVGGWGCVHSVGLSVFSTFLQSSRVADYFIYFNTVLIVVWLSVYCDVAL